MLDFHFLLRTDRHQCEGRGLDRVVEDACSAGVRAVCLGELDLSSRLLWHLASKIAAVCQRYNARLLLTDRVDLAVAVGAAGVVLTSESMPVEAARKVMAGGLIGLAIHSASETATSSARRPDFFLFGPVFEEFVVQRSSSKNRLGQLAEAVRSAGIPVFAYGGVTPLNVPRCLEAGAHGVSMMSMAMSSPNVGLLIEAYARALGDL